MASGEPSNLKRLYEQLEALRLANAKQAAATTSRHQTATTNPQKTPTIYDGGSVPTETSSIQISERFADAPDICMLTPDFRIRTVKYDFRDDEWKDESGIILERLTDIEVADLGRKVIPMMISSGFSRRGAAAVFVLAYHLKAPGSGPTRRRYVFGDPVFEQIADKKFDDYEGEIVSEQGRKGEIVPIYDTELEATAYAYIAASMLRLFVKPPSNYVKSWSHIVNSFSKFYGQNIGVRMPFPLQSAIENLANWFSIDRRAKVTLYRLLYMTNADRLHLDLKRFLYEIHLSNTGMHIVPIVEDLCRVLKCTPGEIIALVRTSRYERQIQSLLKVFEIINNGDEQHRRGMWRYGRIFDEDFMAFLQTKTCPKLVYVLASALQLKEPAAHSGILRIAQLADVSDEYKKKCTESAHLLLKMIQTTGTQHTGSTMPSFY